MRTSESVPAGAGGTSEPCPQAELCLRGLLDRAAERAASGEGIETDLALLNGLDSAVVDADDAEGFYVLACQAAVCDDKYAVGRTIEPQKL